MGVHRVSPNGGEARCKEESLMDKVGRGADMVRGPRLVSRIFSRGRDEALPEVRFGATFWNVMEGDGRARGTWHGATGWQEE